MRTSSSLVATLLLAAAAANAESISPGATYSQDFDSLGNSATASLPSGWSATASTSIQAVTATEWGNAVTATTQQGTGSGTTGGIYNWGESTNTTDRGVGFLATGSVTKTGNLYFSLTATGYIPDFTVSYDVKCYRNNSRQYRFQLYYSTDDGTTWTSAGGDFLTSIATSNSAYYASPSVTSVASKTLDVSLTEGKTIILCWSYSVSSGTQTSNAQGLGIDNVVIVAGQSSGLDPLVTPSFEPVNPADVTTNGFVLRWLAVENALGYDLVVTNVAEQMEAGCQVSYSGPNDPDDRTVTATVTGLDPDTLYAVAVRALADANPIPSSGYSDSDWSTPVEIVTTLEGGLQRAVLLDEGFSGSDNAWTQGSAHPGDAQTDCDSWSFSANSYNARSAVKIGSANSNGAVGWALSPEITLSNEVASANIVLSFSAAAYTGKSTAFSVSLVNSDTGATNAIPSLTALSPDALGSTSAPEWSGGTNYVEEIVAPTRFKILFETISSAADKRLLLDSIKVTQIYDPNYAALPVPTGVAGSDIGKYAFTVSWNAVSNATGYAVWLNGAEAGSCASTATSMELTGLSDGTAYSVQVRALGDNLHYGDSDLSSAITVTTLEDAQKIDFTVTGAPAGDVFAGDTVSFTVAATNESTHAAAPVSFSGIAGATFTAATGAFSWTPTEGDVGSHTATFASGDYSTNVTITVISAFVTTNLFHETFANCTTKWSSSADMPVNGASSKETFVDEPDWTFSGCYRGMSGLKMGTEKAFGTALTRALEPPSVAIPLQLSFRAAAYTGKTDCSLAVAVSDATGVVFSQIVNLTPMPDLTNAIPAGTAYEFGPYPVSVSGDFSLSFTPASGDGRMGVDEILVTQTISAKMSTLPAPTGLAVPTESISTNGFTVGWTAVSDATNYAVRVTDAGGAVAFSAPFCAASPIAVSGLADDVSYTVQVRATGDESRWFASPWSSALAVRTKRSALHPTLTLGPWTNVAGETDPVATLANTAPVSAALDGGAGAVVEYVSTTPGPDSAPTFADGTLSWTPAETDAEKTFSLAFTMAADEAGAPVYTTNVVVSVGRLPETVAPDVTVTNVAWNSFELRWEDQYRASDYRVRVWTGTSDPDATGTEYSEYFEGFPSVKPDGWTFDNGDEAYPNSGYEKTRLAFKSDGTVTSPELSGSVTNLSFEIRPSSGSGPESDLTVQGWTGTAWITIASYTGETLKTEKKTIAGLAGVYSRFRWIYAKDGTKNCGLGSIVFSGTGLPTARFLPGWGTPGKSIGKVSAVTVAKPVPGRFTGRVQNPETGKWEDAGTACVNYAEVTVVGTDGKTASAVVAVPVPYPPRSARATMMILR